MRSNKATKITLSVTVNNSDNGSRARLVHGKTIGSILNSGGSKARIGTSKQQI